MDTNKRKKTTPPDPVKSAHDQAEKDMEMDPDLQEGDPDDDLDEGELARKDNSDEEGFDALERKRASGRHQSGKGSEK
jgi:hypothetical protein